MRGLVTTVVQCGMTLVELLTVISIAALVLGFGIPAFQQIIANNARAAAVNGLVGHLQLARSEAVKRSGTVTVCASTATGVCDGEEGAWGDGYALVVHPGGDDEEVLRRVGDSGRVTVTATRARVDYARDGSAPGSNTRWTICDSGGVLGGRQVVINDIGRPYVVDAPADACP
jgi:type IV fimbrial biogenesis protein FimT